MQDIVLNVYSHAINYNGNKYIKKFHVRQQKLIRKRIPPGNPNICLSLTQILSIYTYIHILFSTDCLQIYQHINYLQENIVVTIIVEVVYYLFYYNTHLYGKTELPFTHP